MDCKEKEKEKEKEEMTETEEKNLLQSLQNLHRKEETHGHGGDSFAHGHPGDGNERSEHAHHGHGGDSFAHGHPEDGNDKPERDHHGHGDAAFDSIPEGTGETDENASQEVALLRLFKACSHRQHRAGKYQGQGRLLILLLRSGTLTQRELTQFTHRRSATLSEQLENMEKAGYIIRCKNEKDKRNVDISLTPQGVLAAKDARQEWAKMAQLLFGVLTQPEKDSLQTLLQKLDDAWAQLLPDGEDTGV